MVVDGGLLVVDGGLLVVDGGLLVATSGCLAPIFLVRFMRGYCFVFTEVLAIIATNALLMLIFARVIFYR